MKNTTKSALLLVSLVCISTSAMADFRDREMGERYRQRHQKMDICAEIKSDLIDAEEAYVDFAERVRTANSAIDTQRRAVNTKQSALSSKQSQFNGANASYTSLKTKQANKPKLIAQSNAAKAQAQAGIPAAQTAVTAAEAHKKRKCKGLNSMRSRCSRAKKAREQRRNELKALQNKVAQAVVSIRELGQIDGKVNRAKRALDNATLALNTEQQAMPTVSQLQTKLDKMIAKRGSDHGGYAEVEETYGRLEIRAEKCMKMQYEAKKASTFEDSLIAFAAQNGAGCETYVDRADNYRSRAKRDGVKAAYNIVCKSDILTREVIVEVEVEVEVPGQPIPQPPVQCEQIPQPPVQCEDNGRNQDSEGTFIKDPFSTGNPYEAELGYRNSKEPLVKVFQEEDAKFIKLDIDQIDMESTYDYVTITDAYGNVVAKLTNPVKGQPIIDYSTKWIKGNSLTVTVTSDKRFELSGFRVKGFSVKY